VTRGGTEQGQPAIELEFTATEVELLVTALGHLKATLGRDETDELEAVQQLLAKIERASAS
jgi:hypothetical protein